MEYTFIFTEQETNVILTALGELPAKVSLHLINRIHTEVNRQNNQEEQYSTVNQMPDGE
ncbi:MAG: hypothetical protein MJE63_03455 [Proteobacteria bacterium]|nr:hypothetical protein [Pseudomonadota bacterium]